MLPTQQFDVKRIHITTEGYFLDTSFYNPIATKLTHFNLYYASGRIKEVELIPSCYVSLFRVSGINDQRTIIRGDYGNHVTICHPKIFSDHHQSTTIARYIREDLIIEEQSDNYVIFKRGRMKVEAELLTQLKNLFQHNDLIAVQAINGSKARHEGVNELLKKHFTEPKLIPIAYKDKVNYLKTLSPQLQKHISEKRGISL